MEEELKEPSKEVKKIGGGYSLPPLAAKKIG